MQDYQFGYLYMLHVADLVWYTVLLICIKLDKKPICLWDDCENVYEVSALLKYL